MTWRTSVAAGSVVTLDGVAFRLDTNARLSVLSPVERIEIERPDGKRFQRLGRAGVEPARQKVNQGSRDCDG